MSLLEQARDYTNLTYYACFSPPNPEFLQHRQNMVTIRQIAELVWRGFINICLFEEKRGLMPRGMPRNQRTAWMEHRSRLMCWVPHWVLREVFKRLVYFTFCRNYGSVYSPGQAWMVKLHVSNTATGLPVVPWNLRPSPSGFGGTETVQPPHTKTRVHQAQPYLCHKDGDPITAQRRWNDIADSTNYTM